MLKSRLTRIILTGVVSVAFACTTGGAGGDPSSATLTVRELQPAVQVVPNETTEINATVEYSITRYDASRRYVLNVFFADSAGAGRTFSTSAGIRLRQAEGVAHVRYPMRDAFRSRRLALPVQATFAIVEQTGADTSRIIGTSEVISWSSEPAAD